MNNNTINFYFLVILFLFSFTNSFLQPPHFQQNNKLNRKTANQFTNEMNSPVLAKTGTSFLEEEVITESDKSNLDSNNLVLFFSNYSGNL